MNSLQILKIGSRKLKFSKIPTHRLDSELILSKVLNKRREEIIVNLEKDLNLKEIEDFNNLLRRRSKGEPIAYIFKEKEFWSKLFSVNRSTLIPRPETELMIGKLIEIFRNKKISILDIGTGSGCILISLLSEIRSSYGLGIDISKNVIEIANKNAIKHGVKNRVKFISRSLTKIFNKKYDLIVSNPPYIKSGELKNLVKDITKFEPKIALDGGNDGLDVIIKVIYKAKDILKINGMLSIEIGNEQLNKVSKILKINNFRIEHKINDYKDNVRCIISKLTQ